MEVPNIGDFLGYQNWNQKVWYTKSLGARQHVMECCWYSACTEKDKGSAGGLCVDNNQDFLSKDNAM